MQVLKQQLFNGQSNGTFVFWSDDARFPSTTCRVWIYGAWGEPIRVVAMPGKAMQGIADTANEQAGWFEPSDYIPHFLGHRSYIILDAEPDTYTMTQSQDTHVLARRLMPLNTWSHRHGTLDDMLFGATMSVNAYTKPGRPEAHGLTPVSGYTSGTISLHHKW